MENRKRLIAIIAAVCLVIAVIIAIVCIAVSEPNDNSDKESDENTKSSSTEENTSWFGDSTLFNDDSTAPEETTNKPIEETTAVIEETTTAPEPEIPMIDLLSALIENNITYYGGDGFGCIEINMSGEANAVISTAGTASLVYTGGDADHFTLKDGASEIVLRVTATPSKGLKTGDVVTLTADTNGIDTAGPFGYRISPVTVTVPELGVYITDTNQLVGEELLKSLYFQGLSEDYKGFCEGALVHSAYIAELNLENKMWSNSGFEGKWKPNVSPAIVIVAVNPAYTSPCRIVIYYNIRTYSGSNEWVGSYSFITRENSDKTTFTIAEAEEALATYLKDAWTLTQIENITPVPIKPNGKLQVEPLKDIVSKLTFKGVEGNGELSLPTLGEKGTIIYTAECSDGDYYFITTSDDGRWIKVVQNNKMIAEFKWGASRYTSLREGDSITLGLGFSGDSPIQTFEELPFQFIPTTLKVPELGKVIKKTSALPSGIELVNALGVFDGQWPSIQLDPDISWYDKEYITVSTGAEIYKVSLFELKPQYTLNDKLETNFCLFVYYKYTDTTANRDYYYGVIYYDLLSYSNGNIRAKYFTQIYDAWDYSYLTISGLENDAFYSYDKYIDPEHYNVTVLYE